MTSKTHSLSMLLVVAAPAAGQSLNVDFGQPANAPSATYAAAGLPGVWNSIVAANGSTTFNLLGLDGAPTPVQLVQVGGTSTLTVNDPQTFGDDGILMDDYLVTFNPNLESCLFIRFLEPARYKVLVYARMPNQPTVMSYTNCDEEYGNPNEQVGGPWPGGHVESVTYSSHIAVPDSIDRIRAHSGISPGANPALGAALNGIQLIMLESGDVDGSGIVDIDDLLLVIASWGPCSPNPNPCPADIAPAPTGGNGSIDVDDLLMVINNWG